MRACETTEDKNQKGRKKMNAARQYPVLRSLTSVTVSISTHAAARARKRAGWTYAATCKMAARAAHRGLFPEAIQRHGLRLDMEVLCPSDAGRVSVLDGEFIFVFSLNSERSILTLVTVYRAPQLLLRALGRPIQWCHGGVGFRAN